MDSGPERYKEVLSQICFSMYMFQLYSANNSDIWHDKRLYINYISSAEDALWSILVLLDRFNFSAFSAAVCQAGKDSALSFQASYFSIR